jgi:hypothetical protein
MAEIKISLLRPERLGVCADILILDPSRETEGLCHGKREAAAHISACQQIAIGAGAFCGGR